MGVRRQRVLYVGALVRHVPELVEASLLHHRAGHHDPLYAVLLGVVHEPHRLGDIDVTRDHVDLGVGGYEPQYLVQLAAGRALRDAYAGLQLLPELRVYLAEGREDAVHEPAFAGRLVVGAVGAEADVFGAVAVAEGCLHGPGVHAAVDGVEYDAAVGPEVGHGAVHQPRGSVAHLEDIHVDYGPHPGVPGLDGSLEGVNPPRAAEYVGPCVDVDVYGAPEQLL